MKHFILAVCLSFASLFALPTLAETSQPPLVSVNVNTASASEIAEVLQGVGESKAQAIVEYREANGAFSSVDEIAQVKGIGQATLAKNQQRITLE
ncbi:ComEA family DNA-binding protein [Halopseudomonas pelagia]|uniref:ComEA family DNA-binding protein n=1 Tax=Halopseudomonas pelagia TaxID=553151 RepID=UPI0003AB1DE3|nr:ComEA family DNA-binding protein [Halopseudomonas pelagia]|tara:strand:+ start:318 stop:602 length:285 start_codon:yes stop_codon:yes gene_type:complete